MSTKRVTVHKFFIFLVVSTMHLALPMQNNQVHEISVPLLLWIAAMDSVQALEMMLEKGDGVKQDLPKALYWYEQAQVKEMQGAAEKVAQLKQQLAPMQYAEQTLF